MAALMPLSLVFLSLHVLCDEPVPTFYSSNTYSGWRFVLSPNIDGCPAAAVKSSTRGLRRTYLHMVLYHKHTRHIVRRTSWLSVHPTTDAEFFFYYDGNFTSSIYAFGVYFLVLRSGQERKNENPVSNPYVRDTTDIYHSGKHSGVIEEVTGIGSDFSRMYYEAPHMYHYFFEYKDPSGKVSRVWEYKPESCAKTAQWFSNEGFYKLDSDTHELTPIYYHPDVADIFY
ncbi:hypothetical protein GCK32_019191 [Trichostrongylus colubriformis]|uniref:Uncharacterized protein n=1 Tax=Trichostrongylus colubriformis TaxID=6319 RepID=A0AAN8IG51_TRICO